MNIALAAALVAGVALLALRTRDNGLRRGPTWDCGYAAPTPRMQYTSGSFGAIATHWFSWILRPELAARRPRGPFPAHASRLERVPETVLERILEPAAGAVMAVAAQVRRTQHGRLQFYIVYVAGGLAVLAMIVLTR